MKHAVVNWLINLLRKGQLAMPERCILIREVTNWPLPDKKLTQDVAMTLLTLVYRAYYFLSDRSIGYGLPNEVADHSRPGATTNAKLALRSTCR